MPSRIALRVAACSMIDISLAPVKKKLIYAITSIKDTNNNKIPAMSWNCWLRKNSCVERQYCLLGVLGAVVLLELPVVGRVGLVILAAIKLILFHSYSLELNIYLV